MYQLKEVINSLYHVWYSGGIFELRSIKLTFHSQTVDCQLEKTTSVGENHLQQHEIIQPVGETFQHYGEHIPTVGETFWISTVGETIRMQDYVEYAIQTSRERRKYMKEASDNKIEENLLPLKLNSAIAAGLNGIL